MKEMERSEPMIVVKTMQIRIINPQAERVLNDCASRDTSPKFPLPEYLVPNIMEFIAGIK
jgi:hypothetical protein